MLASDNYLIFQGANITELGEMFKMDRKEVRNRIIDIPPIGQRQKIDVYRIRDVAPRLCKFDVTQTDLVSRVLATHHTDLPKMLSKEYWYGQNQRLAYLQKVGDLWDTATVVALASETFKTLRLSLMLASDAVERETGLEPRQREIIEEMMHNALNSAREKLIEQFSHLGEEASGKTFAPKEAIAPVNRPDPKFDEWGDEIIGPGHPDYF